MCRADVEAACTDKASSARACGLPTHPKVLTTRSGLASKHWCLKSVAVAVLHEARSCKQQECTSEVGLTFVFNHVIEHADVCRYDLDEHFLVSITGK